jgi:hypothetical protein
MKRLIILAGLLVAAISITVAPATAVNRTIGGEVSELDHARRLRLLRRHHNGQQDERVHLRQRHDLHGQGNVDGRLQQLRARTGRESRGGQGFLHPDV